MLGSDPNLYLCRARLQPCRKMWGGNAALAAGQFKIELRHSLYLIVARVVGVRLKKPTG